MKTVYKYILEPDTVLDMPEGGAVLCVHAQDNGIHLWALVDSAAPLEKRRFVIFGTGIDISIPGLSYIGTVHLFHGRLVFHVFEQIPPDEVTP